MDTNITLLGNNAKLADLIKATGARLDITTAERVALLTAAILPPADVLVIDARDRPFPPAAVASFKRHNPATAVLMVVEHYEAAQLVEAMRAGVSECLADPVTQADLAAAIDRARGRPASGTAGKVIAFVGASGGIGVTTTVVNVAAALAETSPGHVLLIDMDLALGDAALLLGVEPRFTVVDALENIHRLDRSLLDSLVANVAGLDLLASAPRAIPASIGALQIRTLLTFAAQAYPFTVIDVAARDRVALDSLDPVTSIVVLVNQELGTIRRSSHMVRLLQQRYGKERVMVVMTREDKGADFSHADVEKAIGATVVARLPSDYRALQAALNVGRPLVGGESCPLANSFRSLAASLAGFKEQVAVAAAVPKKSPRRFWQSA